MKTFKSLDGSLHAVESGFEYLLPAGSVQISDAEARAEREALMVATPKGPTIEQRIDALEAAVAELQK